MATQVASAPSPILSSWKEIAKYLGKGVRTVQRWECDSGLPVHRPSAHQKGVELREQTRRIHESTAELLELLRRVQSAHKSFAKAKEPT